MNRAISLLEDGESADLQRFQDIYESQLMRGPPSSKAQYDYARCLVRSPNRWEIHQGIHFLEDIFNKTKDDSIRSEYLFYIVVGHTRLKEYEKALKYCRAILKVEPRNVSALELQDYIDKIMHRDGLIGMALVGGAIGLFLSVILGLLMVCKQRK